MKTRTNLKFNLFTLNEINSIWFKITKFVAWSIKTITKYSKFKINCRNFRMNHINAIIFNSINQYRFFAENKYLLKNIMNFISKRLSETLMILNFTSIFRLMWYIMIFQSRFLKTSTFKYNTRILSKCIKNVDRLKTFCN